MSRLNPKSFYVTMSRLQTALDSKIGVQTVRCNTIGSARKRARKFIRESAKAEKAEAVIFVYKQIKVYMLKKPKVTPNCVHKTEEKGGKNCAD